MEMWELAAREGVRDTLARYNWSGDALRLDDLALAFCEDGELQVRGGATHRGRQAIVAFLGGTARNADAAVRAAPLSTGPGRIVRHNLTNIRFFDLSRTQARVESYFTVLTEIGLDHYGRYRDTLTAVGDEWLIQHRFVSTDWRAPDSTLVPPSSVP
jgi:hypothetical protein